MPILTETSLVKPPAGSPAVISSPAKVSVGGLVFGDRDADGVEWTFRKIDGWHSGPSMRVAVRERPNAHGAFASKGFRSPRVIALEGDVWAPTRELAGRAADSLASLLGDGEVDDLTVSDVDMGMLTARVQRASTDPVVDWDTPQSLSYLIEFLAVDPYRYGPEQVVSTGLALETGGLEFPLFTDGATDVGFLDFGESTSTGRVTLSNPGTAEARPVFTVTGDLADGFELVETYTGSRLRYEGPVTSQGDAVTLDSATGRVRLGTADRGGMLTRNDWWGVPAGEAREVLFRSNGAYSTTAQLTVSTRPTYW